MGLDMHAFMKRSSKWGYDPPLIQAAQARKDVNLTDAINAYFEENCCAVERFKREDWAEVESLKQLRNYVHYFMKIHRGIPDFENFWYKNKTRLNEFAFLYDQQAHIESLQKHYKMKSSQDPLIADCLLVNCASTMFSCLSEDLLRSVLYFAYYEPESFMLGEELEQLDAFQIPKEQKSIYLLRSKRTGKLFVKDFYQRASFHILSMVVWEALKKLFIDCDRPFPFDIFTFGSTTYLIKGDPGRYRHKGEWFALKDEQTKFDKCEQPAEAVFNDCLVDLGDSELYIKTPDQELKLPLNLRRHGFKDSDKIEFQSVDLNGVLIKVNGEIQEICFNVQSTTEPVSFPEALRWEIEEIVIRAFDEDLGTLLPGGLRGFIDLNKPEYDLCLGRYFYISRESWGILFELEESCGKEDCTPPKIKVAVASSDGSLVIGFDEFLAELVPKEVIMSRQTL